MFQIKVQQIENTVHTNEGSFLQTPFWCQFKSRHGWSYLRFLANITLNNTELNLNISKEQEISVICRRFAKGKLSIAYIPLLPVPQELFYEDKDYTEEIASYIYDLALSLKPFLPANTIAIRFDPEINCDTPEDRDNFNQGMNVIAFANGLKLKKNKVDIQPPDTTQISLEGTEEEILNRMHQKWRYNIRLSERKGVKIHRFTGDSTEIEEKINKFYELTKETNARDGNSSHAKAYYLDLIKSSADEISKGNDVPLISLYIAEHEGDEIASIMTLFSHDEAIYLYGASSNNKRNLMPNHLLQWTAMKDAKAYGSKYYDMYGMPPEGKDENHPMHGLYMFKANFGGKMVHRTGSWDVPLKGIYSIYSFVENIRAFWYKKVIKKLKGR